MSAPLRILLLLLLVVPMVRSDEPEPGEDGSIVFPENGSVGAALNADNIELKNFLDLVSQRTNRRFVISDEIGTRKVSIISFNEIPDGNLYPLLLSVLDTMQLSLVEKGGAMHVVPLPPGELVGIPDALGGNVDTGGMELRVIPLKHTSATELRRAIQPLVRGGDIGGLGAFGPTNHLLVMETRQRLDLIQQVIEKLDKEGSGRLIEVIPLKHASAEEIAREVTAALSGMETVGTRISRRVQQATGGEMDLPTGNLVIPSPQSNSLILVGAPVDITEARRIIEKLDVASASGSGRHRVIALKYASAEEMAKSLEGLFAKSAGKDEARRIAVEPVISANALLVDANPLDFDNLKVLIDTLDVQPQQVLLEVLIAEMADTDSLDLGVEWATIDAARDGSTTAIGRSRPGETDAIRSLLTDLAFSQGLSLGVARGTFTDAAGNIQPRIPFLLRAVAGTRDVRILSKPALVAQSNKKATVSVVDNIPVLRSTIQGGGGSTRDIVQNIEREDVGLTLTFTPHVTPDSKISIELNPKIAAITNSGNPDLAFTPTISKREINTTVLVGNGETILISGLMREDKIMRESRVPILGRLPVVGFLFRYREERKQVTNLLVFVTPHLMNDPVASEARKQQWIRDAGLPEMPPAFKTSPDSPSVEPQPGAPSAP